MTIITKPISRYLCFDCTLFSVRLLAATDQLLYQQLFTNSAVMQWIGEPLTHSQLTQSFAAALKHNATTTSDLAPGCRVFLILMDQALKSALGLMSVTFNLTEHANRFTAEIGIMLLPFAQRKGLAYAAIARLCETLLQLSAVDSIVCNIAKGNLAAKKLVSQLGFVYCERSNYYKLPQL